MYFISDTTNGLNLVHRLHTLHRAYGSIYAGYVVSKDPDKDPILPYKVISFSYGMLGPRMWCQTSVFREKRESITPLTQNFDKTTVDDQLAGFIHATTERDHFV